MMRLTQTFAAVRIGDPKLSSPFIVLEALTQTIEGSNAEEIRRLLRKWWTKRYGEGCGTSELMAMASNDIERLVISIIALLDVDLDDADFGLNPREKTFVKACHHYLKLHRLDLH